jgi:hypothetical protein
VSQSKHTWIVIEMLQNKLFESFIKAEKKESEKKGNQHAAIVTFLSKFNQKKKKKYFFNIINFAKNK